MRTPSRGWLTVGAGVVAVVLTVLVNAVQSQEPARRQYIGPSTADGERAFSSAVLVDRTLYISGRIAAATPTKESADIEKSIRALLDSYVGVLKEAGMTMDDLVNVQVFAPDVNLYDQFNNIYRSYFTGPLPARAFIGSGQLLRQGHFEMVGIAVKR